MSVQLLQYGSTTLLWDPDLLLVMEAVEKKVPEELSDETAQALRLFLTQVNSLQIILLFFWNNGFLNIKISFCLFILNSQKMQHLTDWVQCLWHYMTFLSHCWLKRMWWQQRFIYKITFYKAAQEQAAAPFWDLPAVYIKVLKKYCMNSVRS